MTGDKAMSAIERATDAMISTCILLQRDITRDDVKLLAEAALTAAQAVGVEEMRATLERIARRPDFGEAAQLAKAALTGGSQ